MKFYVDSEGSVDLRAPPKVQVGPVVSLVNGKPYFTLGMSTKGIRSLDYTYQQLQIGREVA